MIKIVVYGDPRAQKRHRSWSKNGIRGTYDPSSGDKADFLDQCLKKKPVVPLEGPIGLSILFYFSRPKNHFGTGKNSGKLKSWAPVLHTKKPDLDNLVKFVLDALNKIYWKDDAQIFEIGVHKAYSEIPRTEITVNPETNL